MTAVYFLNLSVNMAYIFLLNPEILLGLFHNKTYKHHA